MKLVGMVSKEKNSNGLYTLTIHGLPIPLRGVSDAHAGQRTCVIGKPRWSSDKGSYFKVSKCWDTNKPDKNSVEVEGTIVALYPERKMREIGARPACFCNKEGRLLLRFWLQRCHPISIFCNPVTCLLGCELELVAIYLSMEKDYTSFT